MKNPSDERPFEKLFLQLEESSAYRVWRRQHSEDYLVHIILPLESGQCYEIGFYHEKTEILTTFIIREEVTAREDTELAKLPGEKVLALSRDELVFSQDAAIASARTFVQEHYPRDPVLKAFGVIQHIPLGTVYNITFVSSTFKTITVRISTATGHVLESTDTKLADFLSHQ